jgi:hypothetical protein
MKNFNSGTALLKQFDNLESSWNRLLLIAQNIDYSNDLYLVEYAQLFTITLQYKPDLIIEVGRGYGNSTAVFTEAANQISNTQVISICLTDDWQKEIVPKITGIVPKNWFHNLDILTANILDIKFKRLLKNKQKIIIFWDAHGWEVAEYVLGNILRALKNKDHLLIIHDIWYFNQKKYADYSSFGIWKGYLGDDIKKQPYFVINNTFSFFEEAIAIHDFAARNKVKIHSVEKESREIFKRNKTIGIKYQKLLGEKAYNLPSRLQWFSLNQLSSTNKIFFPKFRPPKKVRQLSTENQKNSMPVVSIVTPSFNNAKFIEECIRSVLAQDYSYIEHIIQDGDSTDATVEILKKYKKTKYKDRIKVFIEKDLGQSDALNRAIQKTKGDIILVLNADDTLMPYAVSWGVEQMKKYPKAAVIYGDTYTINEKGEIIDIYKAHEYVFEKLLCVELVHQLRQLLSEEAL